jgi:hypothetical protein
VIEVSQERLPRDEGTNISFAAKENFICSGQESTKGLQGERHKRFHLEKRQDEICSQEGQNRKRKASLLK